MKDIRITLFDDNADLREGLYHLINMSEGFTLAGSFPDCSHVIENIKDTAPDVVLMDIDMPRISGIEAVQLIKGAYPDLNILMLTVFEDVNNIFEALRAGASGYLLKKASPSKILDAIQEVQRGGAPMSEAIAKKVVHFFTEQNATHPNEYALSPREKEVLRLLVSGYSYKMIASDMFIALETVRSHIKHIYDKLHVNSKTEAVIKAMRDRLI